MFIAILAVVAAFIIVITLRDWARHPRFSSKSIQKSLKTISQLILLQEWERAEKELNALKYRGKGGKEGALFEIQILQGVGRIIDALDRVKKGAFFIPMICYSDLRRGKFFCSSNDPKKP